MAKLPFSNCPLSQDGVKAGAQTCIWDLVRVLGVSPSGNKRQVLYRCRFCNDEKEKVERVG